MCKDRLFSLVRYLMEQPFLYTLHVSDGNILDNSGTAKKILNNQLNTLPEAQHKWAGKNANRIKAFLYEMKISVE